MDGDHTVRGSNDSKYHDMNIIYKLWSCWLLLVVDNVFYIIVSVIK